MATRQTKADLQRRVDQLEKAAKTLQDALPGTYTINFLSDNKGFLVIDTEGTNWCGIGLFGEPHDKLINFFDFVDIIEKVQKTKKDQKDLIKKLTGQ